MPTYRILKGTSYRFKNESNEHLHYLLLMFKLSDKLPHSQTKFNSYCLLIHFEKYLLILCIFYLNSCAKKETFEKLVHMKKNKNILYRNEVLKKIKEHHSLTCCTLPVPFKINASKKKYSMSLHLSKNYLL